MLQIASISKSFEATPILREIDLTVNDGEVICLLGPSGCGKTTLLRVIAGLEQPEAGDIRLEGKSILDIPVHKRNFGLMFQDFALFPHMTVAENVAFGLKMHSIRNVQACVEAVLSLVGMHSFGARDVSQLSGGERQRVALARSLAPNPRLLMLDEPLGSLDANLREQLVVDLRKIIKAVGLTAIYVTHDQMEAFAVADQVAVMNTGKIEQVDTPQNLFMQPKTSFVARFLGLNNVVAVQHLDDGDAHTALGMFPVAANPSALLLHPLGIRLLTSTGADTISGQIAACLFAGDRYRLTMRHESGVALTLKVPSNAEYIPSVGDVVAVSCDMIVPLMS